MKATIIISNYNYADFILEAIESVLNQSYESLQVIVVDDGSTDGSCQLIKDSYDKGDRVTLLEKENGGQLSTFNYAFPHVKGEVVFFLDADDLYPTDYVQKCIQYYESQPDCDFLFTGVEYFGDNVNGEKDRVETRNCGFSVYRAFYLKQWIGAQTSAISMRRSTLGKLLPLELEQDWRIRADDCLVWGASLVGAEKHSYSNVLVKYRIHGANNYFSQDAENDYENSYKRGLKIQRMFQSILLKNNLVLDSYLLRLEFISLEGATWQECLQYIEILFKHEANSLRVVKGAIGLLKDFFSSRAGKG
jgi:glycosyltransferase involved in cell wall biosynthesis